MSNTRYLEIVSTYRNRKLYPLPADFQVLISQSGIRDKQHAYDPVSNAAPQLIWIPNELDNNYLPSGAVDQNPTNTTTDFIACFPENFYNKTQDYWLGSPILVNTIIPSQIIISGWEFINNDVSTNMDCFRIQILPPGLTSIPLGTEAITFLPDATDLALGIVFIPGGVIVDNFYLDYVLYNQTLKQWRPVTTYDGDTKLIGLNISAPYGPIDGIWSKDDIFVLRKTIPQEYGVLGATGTTSSATLGPSASNNSDAYIGDFIRIIESTGPAGYTGPNVNQICRITKYTGAGSVYNPSACPPTVDTDPHVVMLGCILPEPAVFPQEYEILQFTRDNSVPFTYTGSLVSQQEMVCYELELINLVLPNITLKTGGRVAFYPYVYVEFQNVSGASSGNTNIIYSNNPNAVRRLFRCAIDDIPNPLISPFIKINGDGMVQTVKFKPNDNFKFGVYLPDGRLFETVEQETYSPRAANPLIQISALFGLRRL